jgi:hypothetical protein
MTENVTGLRDRILTEDVRRTKILAHENELNSGISSEEEFIIQIRLRSRVRVSLCKVTRFDSCEPYTPGCI